MFPLMFLLFLKPAQLDSRGYQAPCSVYYQRTYCTYTFFFNFIKRDLNHYVL